MPRAKPQEKTFNLRASKHILYLKEQGLSYQWIEHRMGRSENWAKRVAEEGGLTTDGEVDYLLALVQAIKQLPKAKPQNYNHRAKSYIKNTDALAPAKARLDKKLAEAGKVLKKVAKPKKS